MAHYDADGAGAIHTIRNAAVYRVAGDVHFPPLVDPSSDPLSPSIRSELRTFDWTVGANEACVDRHRLSGIHFMVVVDRNTRKLSLDHQIDQLKQLSRDELVELWIKQFKSNPPKGVKRRFLERAVGYHLQAKRYGGLKRETRKALLAIAAGNDPVLGFSPQQKLVPGSRLMREWHGQTHYVDVTDDGYEWNGEVHRSLSAIALAITGTKWSGPRFFGLSS